KKFIVAVFLGKLAVGRKDMNQGKDRQPTNPQIGSVARVPQITKKRFISLGKMTPLIQVYLCVFGKNCVTLLVKFANVHPTQRMRKMEIMKGTISCIPNWLSEPPKKRVIADRDGIFLGVTSAGRKASCSIKGHRSAFTHL